MLPWHVLIRPKVRKHSICSNLLFGPKLPSQLGKLGSGDQEFDRDVMENDHKRRYNQELDWISDTGSFKPLIIILKLLS